MPDYSKGKIYKLWSPELPEDMIYIGSTVNELYKRLSQHKTPTNGAISSYIFLNSNDVRIELIENYPCADKNELNRREGFWIRELKCINKVVAGRTIEEYRDDNKDKIKEQTKEYKKQNKDKIKEKNKQYREDNKDKTKQYLEDNKDKIRERKQKYYEANKERILQRQKEYYQKKKIIQ